MTATHAVIAYTQNHERLGRQWTSTFEEANLQTRFSVSIEQAACSPAASLLGWPAELSRGLFGFPTQKGVGLWIKVVYD